MRQEKTTERIPVTIYLKPSTIERLNKITTYLSFKNEREETLECTIRASIADYLEVMDPLSQEEIHTLRSLLFQPRTEKPYALKNRFKEIMKQKGMKAVTLHRLTEISESNVSQVLNNKNLNMSLDYFLRFWFALDCPPIGDCLFREDLKP
jgi:DNA-binding Xre family transcriptional regulator